MQRWLIPIFGVFVAAVVSGATSDTRAYSWNETKRPPVSLAEALVKAEQLLGDQTADRYCVSVDLYGDQTASGKLGYWALLYAANDGSKKLVSIDMQGDGGVRDWNGPIDMNAKGKVALAGLVDVRTVVERLFAREGIEAQFQLTPEELIVEHHTRPFQVYAQGPDDSYSAQLQTVKGPNADGIWLRVTIVGQPDLRRYAYRDGPYWRWHRATYFTSNDGKYFAVDLRYGSAVKAEVINRLINALGQPTPFGWD